MNFLNDIDFLESSLLVLVVTLFIVICISSDKPSNGSDGPNKAC